MTMMSAKQVIAGLRSKNKELKDKLDAVQTWWNLFNQCIDSEVVKEKLEKILEVSDE